MTSRTSKKPLIIVDTREQKPFRFSSRVETIVRKLQTGDYSLAGYEDIVTIERKSLADFTQTVTRDHDRWRKCRLRLLRFPYRMVICEFDYTQLTTDKKFHAQLKYDSKIKVNVILGNLDALEVQGIPVVMASNKTIASKKAERFLIKMYKKLSENPNHVKALRNRIELLDALRKLSAAFIEVK
jgi:ERCC4-type nuclease